MLVSASADAGPPSQAGHTEPIALVDLRPTAADDDARAALTAAIAHEPGAAPAGDGALIAALTGAAAQPTAEAAANALAEAARAYGELDCARAEAAAAVALDWLSRAQAAGAEVTGSLRTAYAYELLCADAASDIPAALEAARRLRALAPDRPDGVPVRVWDAYPSYDATGNVFLVELAISTEPAGASVFVDHRAVGTSPLSITLPEGRHRVAAATADGRSAVRSIELVGRAARDAALELGAAAGVDPWSAARGWVASWQRRAAPPTEYELAQLMQIVGVRLAIALIARPDGRTELELWGVAPGAKQAQRLGTAQPAQAGELVAMGVTTATVWDRTIAPTMPPRRLAAREGDVRKPWWVYAAIVGAVAAGAFVMIAGDQADDTQIIELHYP